MADDPKHMEVLKKWYKANDEGDLRYKYKLDANSIIIDGGAYNGKWAIEMYNRYKCTIHCYEPVKSMFEVLKNATSKFPGIKPYCQALGNNDRQEIIYVNKDGSSMFNKSSQTEKISVIDINKATNKKNSLLKLNVEGSEYEILEKLVENDMLNRFDNLQIQFHRDVPRFNDRRNAIRKALSKTHKEEYNFEFVWESWTLK